jgi:hypothetical protein
MRVQTSPSQDSTPWEAFADVLTGIFLVLTVLLAAASEKLLPEMPVSGLHPAMILYAAAAGLILTRCLLRRLVISTTLAILTAGGVFMSTMAIINLESPFQSKSFGGDLLIYSALIIGFLWAATRNRESVLRHLRLASLVTLAIGVLTIGGLVAGLIESLGTGDRLVVYSIYWISWFLTCVSPLTLITARETSDGESAAPRLFWRAISYGSILTVFAIGLISATRSVLLGGGAALLIMVWLELREFHLRSRIAFLCLASLVLLIAGGVGLDTFKSTELGARLYNTSVRDESRFTEINEMIEEQGLGWPIVLGEGFGSVFFTTTVSSTGGGGSYVLSPHVGILTLFFKGGLLVFIPCIVWPFCRCVWGLLTCRDQVRIGAYAGGVLYCVLASISGGWDFRNVFLLGVCYAIAFRPIREQLSAESEIDTDASAVTEAPAVAQEEVLADHA